MYSPREKFHSSPTPKVEVADTVGAGDSFTAAFIASILKGKSVPEAHHKAVATSAFVCIQQHCHAIPVCLPPLRIDFYFPEYRGNR